MELINGILSSLTWQFLLFVFGLVFILLFKKQISELIPKVTKIGKDGVTAQSSPEDQGKEEKTSEEAVQQLLDAVGNSLVINQLEDGIRASLVQERLPSDTDTARVLIKHLAGTQLLLAFERIYTSIFGSQIILLKNLNEVTGQGLSVENVKSHFENVQNKYSERLGNWSLEQYLSYLFSSGLVVDEDSRLQITNLGVEYLIWIVRNGKSENKDL